jgi:hypothetical protein
MVGKVTRMGLYDGLTIETTLDPKIQPFLHDHQIEGTPVLPGVTGIEAFAESALSVLPGWQVEAVEDVNFLAPFKFYRNEPRTLTIRAVFHPEGNALVADCRLMGRRPLPNQAEPQVTTHFTARVRLTQRPFEAKTTAAPAMPEGTAVGAADIYRVFFHGPAYRVLDRAWRDGERIMGQMAGGLPRHHHPPGRPLSMAPRLIELCFQTAALWAVAAQGRIGLPQHVHTVSLLRAPELAEGPLYAVVTPRVDGGSCDAEVVDASGAIYLQMRGYRMVEHPDAVDAEPLKALQAVMAEEPHLVA